MILGHWLVVDVVYRNGELSGHNVLGHVGYAGWLTLVLQAVPVFFLVGGYGNAVSWSRHRGRGGRWHTWVQRRVCDLVWPTTFYVTAMTLVFVVLIPFGVDTRTLSLAGWIVALHLWFLSVYLAFLVLAPVQVAAHRRWGLRVPVAMAAAAAAVDVAVIRWSLDQLGWANYLLVWGCVHQLGIAWQQGSLTRRRAVPVLVAVTAVATLVALVWSGPYPVSMVGVPGADVQNTSPPTLALLVFAVVQTGILVAGERVVSPRLERPARASRIAAANRLALTGYLWHMVPVVLVATTAYPAGVMPQPEPGTATWWLSRVLWVALLVAVLALLARALAPTLPWLRGRPYRIGRFTAPAVVETALLLAGAAALVAALARLALDGFGPRPPWPVLLLYGAGFLLVLLAGPPVERSGPAERAGEPGVADDDRGGALDQPKRVQRRLTERVLGRSRHRQAAHHPTAGA